MLHTLAARIFWTFILGLKKEKKNGQVQKKKIKSRFEPWNLYQNVGNKISILLIYKTLILRLIVLRDEYNKHGPKISLVDLSWDAILARIEIGFVDKINIKHYWMKFISNILYRFVIWIFWCMIRTLHSFFMFMKWNIKSYLMILRWNSVDFKKFETTKRL